MTFLLKFHLLLVQETPTKELGEHSYDSNSQAPELSGAAPPAGYLNRFTNSESSTDEEGNQQRLRLRAAILKRPDLCPCLRAGGGFEWDDDFSSPAPAFPPKGKASASKAPPFSAGARFSSPPPVAGRVLEPSWSSSSNYSRFSISPASIASFSLTHLTDSDIEQGGKLTRFRVLDAVTGSFSSFTF